MRPTVIISADDGTAALQILAHLAYPRRAAFALNVLEEWDRHRAGSPTEKRGRVDNKLRSLDRMIKRHLVGSYWLRWRFHQVVPFPSYRGKGQREAARLYGYEGQPEGNAIRDRWTEARSVLHLGLATIDGLTRANSVDEARAWSLERVAFRPDWVAHAIGTAEMNAAAADQFGIIPLNTAILFRRDNL